MNVTGYIHTYFQILNYSFKPDLFFLQEWKDSKQHMEFFYNYIQSSQLYYVLWIINFSQIIPFNCFPSVFYI